MTRRFEDHERGEDEDEDDELVRRLRDMDVAFGDPGRPERAWREFAEKFGLDPDEPGDDADGDAEEDSADDNLTHELTTSPEDLEPPISRRLVARFLPRPRPT